MNDRSQKDSYRSDRFILWEKSSARSDAELYCGIHVTKEREKDDPELIADGLVFPHPSVSQNMTIDSSRDISPRSGCVYYGD